MSMNSTWAISSWISFLISMDMGGEAPIRSGRLFAFPLRRSRRNGRVATGTLVGRQAMDYATHQKARAIEVNSRKLSESIAPTWRRFRFLRRFRMERLERGA